MFFGSNFREKGLYGIMEDDTPTTSPQKQWRSLRKKPTQDKITKNKHDKKLVEPQQKPEKVKDNKEEVEEV